jgi:hypothetical protein
MIGWQYVVLRMSLMSSRALLSCTASDAAMHRTTRSAPPPRPAALAERADPEREERRRSPARAEHGEGKDAAAATVARRADWDGAEAAGRREAARRSAIAPRALCFWNLEGSASVSGDRRVRGWSAASGGLAAAYWMTGEARRRRPWPWRGVCGAARLESNLARPMEGRRVDWWTAREDDELKNWAERDCQTSW